MPIDRKITWGNIISWAMIVIGMAVGWGKLQSATEQNTKDVAAAVLLAQKVEENQRMMDAKRDTQINSLTVAVAVTEVTVKSIDKKLDELIRRKSE